SFPAREREFYLSQILNSGVPGIVGSILYLDNEQAISRCGQDEKKQIGLDVPAPAALWVCRERNRVDAVYQRSPGGSGLVRRSVEYRGFDRVLTGVRRGHVTSSIAWALQLIVDASDPTVGDGLMPKRERGSDLVRFILEWRTGPPRELRPPRGPLFKCRRR